MPPRSQDATPPRRLLVSGIGRSGTTLIFQQLAKLLLLETEAVNFRYEPYLWDIQSAAGTNNRYGIAQLHHFGLHTHRTVPLFLDGPDPVHDPFLDGLFDAPLDSDRERRPDACLVKVIRGSGRLRAYLKRFPDLKVVVCQRNPLDTINSSLGMFSFFGEEFHADDRDRFVAELTARGRMDWDLPAARQAVEWYGAWWRVFTEETLAVARDFPDNVFLFCHEAFQADRDGVLEALQDFVGLHNIGIRAGLGRSAGLSIKTASLTSHDLAALSGHARYYRHAVLEPALGLEAAYRLGAEQLHKFAARPYTLPLAGSDLGQKNTIQLRDMMLRGRTSPWLRTITGPQSPIDLHALLEEHAGDDTPLRQLAPETAPAALRHGKRYGVVITCHNNKDTIVGAVLSCLSQTLPFDRVLVVDDASKDGSRDRLAVLAEHFSSLQVEYLDSRVGPAAAREIGIRRLDTDFFTQLDGDDLFWPTKNAEEARVLAGDETAIAFSDILLVLPETSLLRDTSAYEGAAGSGLALRMASRAPQIPRDMTLSRARYFAAGGYHLASHLYEDWDLKLRLAALEGGEWRRSAALAGTVYNRLKPGLSGADPGHHARALSIILMRNLRHLGLPPEHVLEAYRAALQPFSKLHLTRTTRAWLKRRLAQEDGTAAVSDLAAGRAWQALSNAELIETMEREIAQDKAARSEERA
ncbi:glycosyltransferase [Oceanicola granulosus HTCC2516]|uniref:Glycosyltransferase n=1 Tax=Oceanicola granulosus (strain ATCC BAA-861 / DSM 15982 / KCTC 12143 / HTCC2516) TaxID=314256 RepID=Q2CBT4_OCEGH|nr:glycosyltransferase [Oceanicola granulosus]EAR50120.1 glycosyltransferase [Oceanicola granulosus HTCC2516]